ncbi:hypothetical protein ACN20G_36960 (plasmid) [Streptomyces sp. BI20]|uniref:hypothetical protein n=1 Tax=Streptomyces sp. BI20 TaxID=3403460 RepID=UPI003C73FEC0
MPEHPDAQHQHEDEEALRQPGGDLRQAQDAVHQVLRHLNAALLRAAEASAADETERARLRALRAQALEAVDRLEEAEPEEVVEIAVRYAALLKQLTQD